MTTAYAFAGTGSINEQLDALTGALDPHTKTWLCDAGVAEGWQVLEAGAGSGTIATWLADRVGPHGHVTAVDIDTSRIPAHPAITTQQLDLTTDAVRLPDGVYDLIHARLVLIHLPQREQIVRDLPRALAPGGLLVLHEFDCTFPRTAYGASHDDKVLFERVIAAVNNILAAAGAQLDWGTRAHDALTAAGLVDVTTRVHAETFGGRDAWARLGAINTVQLQSLLLQRGLTEQDLTRYRDLMADPDFTAMSYLMTSTTGRRPA